MSLRDDLKIALQMVETAKHEADQAADARCAGAGKRHWGGNPPFGGRTGTLKRVKVRS